MVPGCLDAGYRFLLRLYADTISTNISDFVRIIHNLIRSFPHAMHPQDLAQHLFHLFTRHNFIHKSML